MRAVRLVAAVVAVGVVLAAAGCGSAPAGPPKPSTPAVTPGYTPPMNVERGPKPPANGAWMGAWVKPEISTPAGRATAFADFEDEVGGQLPIVHNYQQWTDSFPGPQENAMLAESDLLMLSWAGTDTRSVVSGSYDTTIRQRAEQVRDWKTPVLLRFRWEMDRPNLAASVHSPEDFITAWKYVRKIFTEVGATNAGWVWCPHVEGFTEEGRNAAAYYPGDDQVDWLCVDVYSGPEWASFGSQMDAFLAFAQQHPKPIVVGEFGVSEKGEPGQRANWLREVRSYVPAHPQIKALVYFYAKQDRKPLYDTTFVDDPDGLAAFRDLVADPYFKPAVPTK